MQHRSVASAAVVAVLVLCSCQSAFAAQNFGKELASLDFGNIIGGPLRAVVNAQLLAAKETINFIHTVGFQPDPADTSGTGAVVTRTVDFSYRTVGADNVERTQTLTVPLLTMVPIPYLQFETIDIVFSVSLGNVDNANTSVDISANISGENPKMSGSMTTTSKTNAASSYSQTYAMNIHVAARQADMPEGTMKLIDKLTSIIRSTVLVTSSASS